MTTFLKSFKVRDGYFGKKTWVYLCYEEKTGLILVVHRHGWYHAGFPQVKTAAQAKDLLESKKSIYKD